MSKVKAFIREYDLNNIRRKFLILIILNAIDMILTYIGITNSYGEEINLILKPYVTNLNVMTLVKVVFPTIAFIILYNRMKKATEGQLKISNRLVNGIMVFYFVVVASHLGWISMATISLLNLF